MSFTPLHRALGRQPDEPLDSDMLDEAIREGVAESADLDWKKTIYSAKGITQGDFPKDVAAMANSGGGLIVCGVEEEAHTGRAKARCGIDEVSDEDERAVRSAAVTAISPPVFGLRLTRIGVAPSRALVIEVPASMETPHMVFRNDLFGAPIRNGASTAWMQEPQIERLYRARFNERRNADEGVERLWRDAASWYAADDRPYAVGVARPQTPHSTFRRDERAARRICEQAGMLAQAVAPSIHPFYQFDWLAQRNERLNAWRPALRQWRARILRDQWQQASAAIHDDDTVVLVQAVGGASGADLSGAEWKLKPCEVFTSVAEGFARDLLCLAEAAAPDRPWQCDVLTGFVFTGTEQPRAVMPQPSFGTRVSRTYSADQMKAADAVTPDTDAVHDIPGFVERFRSSFFLGFGLDSLRSQVYDLARDLVNMLGCEEVRSFEPPADDSSSSS